MALCLIYILQTSNTLQVMKRFVMSALDSDYQGIAVCRVQGDMDSWEGGWSRLRNGVSADKYHVLLPRLCERCCNPG